MCPDLYDIINNDEIKSRHVYFHYKRTDSKIFKHFCRKYRIRNTKVLRKTFLENPEVLITFLHLKDAGFRDMNLYNRVITNKEYSQKIDGLNPRSLAFFCQFSIKKRGQKATLNTILRETSEFEDFNDYVYDERCKSCEKNPNLDKFCPSNIVIHINHSLPGAGLTAYRLVRSDYHYT